MADMPITLSHDLPPSDEERAAFLMAAGQTPREAAPDGFRGVAAVWARDRDLLVGQGVVLEMHRRAAARDRIVPRGWPEGLVVGLVDLICVRPEYREIGLEERLLHALLRRFRVDVPCRDALLYVGEARAPVLLSTFDALGGEMRDAWLA